MVAVSHTEAVCITLQTVYNSKKRVRLCSMTEGAGCQLKASTVAQCAWFGGLPCNMLTAPASAAQACWVLQASRVRQTATAIAATEPKSAPSLGASGVAPGQPATYLSSDSAEATSM